MSALDVFNWAWNGFGITVLSWASTHVHSPVKHKKWGLGGYKKEVLEKFNYPVQAPTLIRQELSHCRFAHASSFSQVRAAWQCGKLYCARKRANLQSCFQGLQRSSPAVHEYHTARGEHCGQGYDRCVQTLLLTVVAPEAHQNDRST